VSFCGLNWSWAGPLRSRWDWPAMPIMLNLLKPTPETVRRFLGQVTDANVNAEIGIQLNDLDRLIIAL
jgi:hypothetical protein